VGRWRVGVELLELGLQGGDGRDIPNLTRSSHTRLRMYPKQIRGIEIGYKRRSFSDCVRLDIPSRKGRRVWPRDCVHGYSNGNP